MIMAQTSSQPGTNAAKQSRDRSMLNTKPSLTALTLKHSLKKHQRDSTTQPEAETNHRKKESTTDVEEMVETEKILHTCKYDGGDGEADKMINCDICEGWYHLSCVELNEKEALEMSFWVCTSCKDSHLLVKSLKADQETLKMKLQTVEHSLASDIDIPKN